MINIISCSNDCHHHLIIFKDIPSFDPLSGSLDLDTSRKQLHLVQGEGWHWCRAPGSQRGRTSASPHPAMSRIIVANGEDEKNNDDDGIDLYTMQS